MAEPSQHVTQKSDSENAPPVLAPASPSPATAPSSHTRPRGPSGASARLRSASQKFFDSNMPSGFMSATGEAAAKAPSLSDIRRGSFGSRRASQSSNTSPSLLRRASTQQSLGGSPATAMDATTSADVFRGESSQPVRTGNPPLAMMTEDDGFPDIIFGRGEMSDQSYVPKNARKVETEESDAVQGDTDGADSDQDELDPQPKRRSKNLKAMFGETPTNSISKPAAEPDVAAAEETVAPVPDEKGVYPNGYYFPPDKTWGQATVIGLKAFVKFTFTPMGFFIVIYGLNVVAWGGMLFLLLCNASPVMCGLDNGTYDCNDLWSPRRIWVEIDSQILNALFCVTGFGLIPWRFRDFYYLMRYRILKDENALRKLAGYHRGWYRLPGSDKLPVKDPILLGADNPAQPIPIEKAPKLPLTGARAPPTASWKMDYFVWMFVLNTFLQAVLSGFMWGLNRFDRPSWSTGLFVGLACLVAILGGICQFREGQRIKKIEGIKWGDADTTGDVEQSRFVQQDQDHKEKGERREKLLRILSTFC